jgi:hypothetical protein
MSLPPGVHAWMLDKAIEAPLDECEHGVADDQCRKCKLAFLLNLRAARKAHTLGAQEQRKQGRR